jgi:16S rRNA processing protein RimM
VAEGAHVTPWIELGVIAKPHGTRGELRVHVFNPDSTLLEELEEVFLVDAAEQTPSLVRIESTRHGPKALLMQLEGVRSRDGAEALRGYRLCVPREALPELEEGEYYHADLIGLEALERDRPIGEVIDVVDYPSAECLKIERPAGYIEVPMLERWLDRIDLDHGKVYLKDLSDIPLQKWK